MSLQNAILAKKGILQNVPPGRRVRIDPQLRAPSARISPADVGDPTFQTTDNPPLAPTDVNLSTGFQLMAIDDNPDSAYFGCFYAQNVSEYIKDMVWEAVWNFSTQQEHNANIIPVQTDVGTRGEGGGSPQSIHPIAIQGEAILYNRNLVTPGAPLIEECNNKIIIFEDNPAEAVTLPVMGAEQHGMQVLLKLGGFLSRSLTITSQLPATIDLEGYDPYSIPPNPGPTNQFVLDAYWYCPGAVLLTYNHYNPGHVDWIAIRHDHAADIRYIT